MYNVIHSLGLVFECVAYKFVTVVLCIFCDNYIILKAVAA